MTHPTTASGTENTTNGSSAGSTPTGGWPLWEVFIRPNRGLSHVHAGSLHAADARMALANARDLYTRRSEGVSLWVVPSEQITASEPDSKDSYFEPAADKVYRHPTFYTRAEGVPHL
ncbi:1,2-phenylacetyl-CoA epoxidase subunit PaaB [Brevibacterium luteolum]|uniref:1,2-phenylacetyl-CoA epoxidase subunit B n=1 Tax=Brevibacterium luteolum TaxID=199591 RepID=A0A849AVP8_9MICO|nr:1,2-phenylacetyl-CoA epoxidase subunit PaaB [Brevibacterium luteolum]MBM7530122.1 ring-1,2-phenylacetyl-CoA epoxidase subunit PaaB [Brevibacterium luteolum]MCT1920748.1 1,2-phenylacetyl-CoA epoxidase subunit B [Brevibacterium luteolum]NNG80131.1 1,2-phenylacetyl-CoA epoxidase subunit B [Brevibacterium luteolum]